MSAARDAQQAAYARRRAALIEDLEFILRTDPVDPAVVVARLRRQGWPTMTVRGLERTLQRLGRTDLMAAMRAVDWLAMERSRGRQVAS